MGKKLGRTLWSLFRLEKRNVLEYGQKKIVVGIQRMILKTFIVHNDGMLYELPFGAC